MCFQFDLHDEFLIRNIRVSFTSPGASRDDLMTTDMRPRAVKIEVRRRGGQGNESSSSEETWTAWRYYSDNCSAYFPGITEQVLDDNREFPSEAATSVVCVRKYFAGDGTTQINEGYGPQEVRHDSRTRLRSYIYTCRKLNKVLPQWDVAVLAAVQCRPTDANAPGGRPGGQPDRLQRYIQTTTDDADIRRRLTTDDRRQRAKQYRPIRRASNNSLNEHNWDFAT